MTAGIHQSHYLPWLRYFEKIARSDRFIVLDDVQFAKNGWQNRNRIKTPQGWTYLTVPVSFSLGDPIHAVRVAGTDWQAKHWRALELNYRRAPYWERYAPALRPLYERPWERLVDLNRTMLSLLLELLEIHTPVVYSSELGCDARATERLARLCQAVGANRYLSGAYALDAYLDPACLAAAGISLAIQEWTPPVYPQQFPRAGFVPDLSIVDLLFNVGPASREVLLAAGRLVEGDGSSGSPSSVRAA